MKQYFVYIMSNDFLKNPTLYSGVTNNLVRRTYEHQQGLGVGFTNKYNLKKLVFFETYNSMEDAIQREKQLKHWNREWKLNLIKQSNPSLKDLFQELL